MFLFCTHPPRTNCFCSYSVELDRLKPDVVGGGSIGITIPMMMEQLIKMQASQVQMQADTKEQFQEISERMISSNDLIFAQFSVLSNEMQKLNAGS